MLRTSPGRIALFVVVQLVGLVSIAGAQATRTWVSGVGDDANPCSRTAPCKTFAGAISKTAAGGEISALDPGGYGAVTITKSITISGTGTLASILASGTNGVIVNAGANDEVVLRGISIHGGGTGLSGIRYLAGGQLTVEDVAIEGFQGSATGRAIDVSLASSGKLMVRNSTITNCEAGIRLTTTFGSATATLDNVRIEGTDTHAVEALANSIAAITRSNLSNNFNAGVRAAAASSVVNVEDTLLAFNNAGVNAAVSGARIRISNATIVNNVTGIAIAAGAVVQSAGNNRVDGNGSTALPNDVYQVD